MDKTALQTMAANILECASPERTAFTISGTTYYGQKTALKQDVRFSEYGYGSGYEFSLVCNVSDFVSVPADNTEVTISGTVYRIMFYEIDSAGVLLTLHIGDRAA
jgi:hypothetical protein